MSLSSPQGWPVKRYSPSEVSTELDSTVLILYGLLAMLFFLLRGDLKTSRSHEVSIQSVQYCLLIVQTPGLGLSSLQGWPYDLRDTVLTRSVHSSYSTVLALYGLLVLLFLLSRGDLRGSRPHEVSIQSVQYCLLIVRSHGLGLLSPQGWP